MKKHFTRACVVAMLSTAGLEAQTYSPVTLTNFNADVIAENNPASSTTNNVLDGSNYVLYSNYYGSLHSSSYGLPNSGTIVNGTRSYQLGSYTANNVLKVTAGLTDSVILATPASFAGISLLGFATEGSQTIDVTLRFTDGTSALYSGKNMPDWFYNPSPVISGFDRAGQASGTPDFQSGQPNMYAIDLNLSCANQARSLSKVLIHNLGTNPRICLFAISGAAPATYSTSSSNLTCNGLQNGTAVITPSAGVTPYTYTWTTSPAQSTASVSSLAAGNYTATVKDATGCPSTFTFAITEPAPGTLTVTATSMTVCSNSSTTLTAAGATSYTWANSANGPSITLAPISNAAISVNGTDAMGCVSTGSIAISVYPHPAISFSVNPNMMCNNAPNITLTSSPAGGTYSGTGVTGSTFSPGAAGVGSYTLSYTYVDAHSCANIATSPVTVTFCTGIETLASSSAALYPNPSNGFITVKLEHAGNGSLDVYDAMGRLVMSQALGAEENHIDLSALGQGIYHYTISLQEGGMSRGKLIRQ